jgi:hypothetical protein
VIRRQGERIDKLRLISPNRCLDTDAREADRVLVEKCPATAEAPRSQKERGTVQRVQRVIGRVQRLVPTMPVAVPPMPIAAPMSGRVGIYPV